MENLILSPISIEEFERRISSLILKKIAENTDQKNRYISIRQACQKFDLFKATLYNWKRQGFIKIHSLSGKSFIDVQELEEAILKGC